jgi:uncharacterized protein (TIGR04255 family)
MPPVRHLAKAPIREALLDVRVELPAEFSATVFKGLKEVVGLSYPKMTEAAKHQATLQLGPSGKLLSESTELGLHAVRFSAADDKTVVQFRTDGFTLNRLRPYTEWESIFPEAMRLWAIYAAAASPASVTKVGLRYINEFLVPGTVQSLARYLTGVPGTPLGAPGRVKGFLSRVGTEDEETRLSSVVTYSVSEHVDGSQAQVVFDIEVFCSAVSGTDSGSLIPVFTRLRSSKNAIFFESLTEATLTLFD